MKKKAKRQEERSGKEGAHKFRSDSIKKGKKRQEERLGEEGAHKLRSDAAKKGQAKRKVKSMHDPKSLENRRKSTKKRRIEKAEKNGYAYEIVEAKHKACGVSMTDVAYLNTSGKLLPLRINCLGCAKDISFSPWNGTYWTDVKILKGKDRKEHCQWCGYCK